MRHEHDGYYCQTLNVPEHVGAHVDAPAHTVPCMMDSTIEKVPVDFLVAPAVVYDLEPLGLEPGDQASEKDFLALEKNMNDGVKPGEIALLRFGWEKYWKTDKEAHFYSKNAPGVDRTGVEFFAARKVRAVGSDTIACDIAIKDGVTQKTWGHEDFWLPNNILIIEELMNLYKLPSRCYFMAFPLKIKEGSGSPIRPVALVPKHRN